jgi:hypothetical protein
MATKREIQQKAEAWIRAQWRDGADTPCPMCGHNFWSITQPLALPIAPEGAEGVIGMVGHFLPIVCETCGTAQMVAVHRVGERYPGLVED